MGVVLTMAARGRVDWVASEVLELEIAMNPDPLRRSVVMAIATRAHRRVGVGAEEAERARLLVARGFGSYDALHLACAEAAADVFLTTDDRLMHRAADPASGVAVTVRNPVRWLEEVLGLWTVEP